MHVLLSRAKVLSVEANRNPQLLSAKIVNDLDTKRLGGASDHVVQAWRPFQHAQFRRS